MIERIRNMPMLRAFDIMRKVLFVGFLVMFALLFSNLISENVKAVLVVALFVTAGFLAASHTVYKMIRNEEEWRKKRDQRQAQANKEIAENLGNWLTTEVDGIPWRFKIIDRFGTVIVELPVPKGGLLFSPLVRDEKLYVPYRMGDTTTLGNPLPEEFTPTGWVAKLRVREYVQVDAPEDPTLDTNKTHGGG